MADRHGIRITEAVFMCAGGHCDRSTALSNCDSASTQVVPEGERPAGADRTLYALHPIPLSDVKAVRKHAPAWGTQHVVLVLNNGLTLPPLYFAAGGVKSLFSALKEVRHYFAWNCC